MKTGEGGLLQVCMEGVGLLFAYSKVCQSELSSRIVIISVNFDPMIIIIHLEEQYLKIRTQLYQKKEKILLLLIITEKK